MLVCHEKKYIFIHIPRTGGTSITKCVVGEPTRSAHGMSFFKERYRKEYFVFCFVRNPFDRLVSSFHHAKRMSAGKSRIRQFVHENPQMPFSEFVLRYLTPELIAAEGHFRPQAFWTNAASPDFIGRFERFTDDFDKISGRLKLKTELGRKNFTGREADYRAYYTDQAVEKVAEFYREDLDLFKYDFSGPLPVADPMTDERPVKELDERLMAAG
jgi:chondroitin 4-sulfotransferase 11